VDVLSGGLDEVLEQRLALLAVGLTHAPEPFAPALACFSPCALSPLVSQNRVTLDLLGLVVGRLDIITLQAQEVSSSMFTDEPGQRPYLAVFQRASDVIEDPPLDVELPPLTLDVVGIV
jgi:hypothetical protein